MKVPNQFPLVETTPYRLAIIGEAPGADEAQAGRPFVGMSGRFLTDLCASAGILRDGCFVGNVCQVRPPGNDITEFEWAGPEIQEGLNQLKTDLDVYNPHLCLLLGNTALRASRDNKADTITNWRGSLYESSLLSHTNGRLRKAMASYHPAAVLREYSYAPILKFDLKRAKEEALSPMLNLPQRELITPQGSPADYLPFVISELEKIKREKPPISVDIEGYVNAMTCISIATSATRAFIIPFTTGVGRYWPDVYCESSVWRALSSVLTDPGIPKILQNSLYDNFVLTYSYKCPIRGIRDDTMLKHWELYCELEKGLGFQASIYTKEPYYKADRKTNDLQTYWRYCCRDSAITYEINTKLDEHLTDKKSAEHYRFNIAMLAPVLYMEQRGIRYDTKKAQERHEELTKELAAEQAAFNKITGENVNVGSTKQMQAYFYGKEKLPVVTNRATGRPTLNYEALLSLAKKTGHPGLLCCIKIRSLSTRTRMLEIYADADGRIRCGYNVVGTDTGRLTCYTSPTGSGYNLQTIPEYDRDLFLADDGFWMFQCDLSGADGWTVAAHCASLGDPTMLEDLRNGIKIAKVVAAMFLQGPEVSRLEREELRKVTEGIPKDAPIYFGSKCCQHGSNYGMGKVLLSQTIFIQSEGKVNIPAADAQKLQDFYFLRYPGVKRWHHYVENTIRTKGRITSAAGHTRVFFGRRNDHATLKAGLSYEPQINTTWATNQATLRLWGDRDNRLERGNLRCEPLHTVHDALVGQFPQSETEDTIPRIRGYFDNPLVIAGIPLTIPFEGKYGPAWGGEVKGKF